ncbi:MAG: hypothetical protein JKX93_04950 [Rhizobiaceae bacterium]|nr:hypothetical protein [Rhizobiaceae bacterium]
MQEYNFWADLLDTYQSLSDWVKALWLLVPPGFLLALSVIISKHKIAYKKAENQAPDSLTYTIFQNDNKPSQSLMQGDKQISDNRSDRDTYRQ